jgi:hypothetical protein
MPQAPLDRHLRSSPAETQQLFVLATFEHVPVNGLHESLVHELLSLQLTVVPRQIPPPHTSLVVHKLLSLQASVLFAFTQPVDVLHESVVHALLSLQLIVVPPHVPFVQVSPLVHALLSLQVPPEMFVWTQPVAGLHVSVVHGLLSLQFGAGPPAHEPFAHVSAVVHMLLSLHAAVLFV